MNARLIAALAIVVGLVWTGQGLGYIPGSFMTGDPFWALAGAALTIGGIVIVVADRRRRSPPPA